LKSQPQKWRWFYNALTKGKQEWSKLSHSIRKKQIKLILQTRTPTNCIGNSCLNRIYIELHHLLFTKKTALQNKKHGFFTIPCFWFIILMLSRHYYFNSIANRIVFDLKIEF
jgi:hypothetical protein